MIWYLHWLQMRREAKIGPWAILASGVIFLIAIQHRDPAGAHQVSLPLPTLLAATYLAGNGLRVQGSTSYSLSLPIGRTRIIVSRLLTGWLLVAGMLVLLLGANTALLAILNKPIPIALMAQTSVLALVAAAPALAVGGLLRFYVSDRFATYWVWALSWMLVPQLGLAARNLPWSDFTFTPGMIVGYSALSTAILFSLTSYLGQRKEF